MKKIIFTVVLLNTLVSFGASRKCVDQINALIDTAQTLQRNEIRWLEILQYKGTPKSTAQLTYEKLLNYNLQELEARRRQTIAECLK